MIAKFTYLFILIVASVQMNAATIVVNNTNDSGTGSLRDAVNQALDGDIIQFNSSLISSGNATINLLSEINITKSIQVVGLFNATDTLFISGGNASRIFNVDLASSVNPTLVLDDLFIINGRTINKGGAIYVTNVDSIFISSSLFKSNYAANDGGAIYTNNNCYLKLSNSSFVSDTSMNMGGAIYMRHRSSMLVENSFFDMNYAHYGGGAIFNYSNSSTTNLSELIINKSVFKRNRRNSGEGGAIYSQKANITIDSSLFTENIGSAIGVTSIVSAASSTAAFLHINETDFIDNMSFAQGGALNLENYNVDITNCTFDANVGSGGGAIGASLLIINVSDTKFTNNTGASSGGGAIRFSVGGSSSNFTNCSFSYNSGNYGGALRVGGDANIHSCTFDHNTSQVGGAIYGSAFSSSSYNTNILISKSTITENYSSNNGGGLYFLTTGSRFVKTTIENSTIYKNSTGGSGGAINLNASTIASDIKLKSCIVAENGASTIVNTNSPIIVSQGYNIFSDISLTGQDPTDQMSIDSAALDLKILQNYGGTTFTRVPGNASVAIDLGDPSDLTTAQNISVVGGRRDVGAAEYVCKVYTELTISTCNSYVSHDGNTTWTTSGIYYDTISQTGCDSVTVVYLTINSSFSSSIVSTCNSSYTSPSGLVWSTSGNYVDTIPNAIGCDSIISIDLTINTIDVSVSQAGALLTANETGATYQWLDCPVMTAIGGATNQSYNATSNGNYAVVVTKNGCSDTSVCYTITVVGIIENGFENELIIFPYYYTKTDLGLL